MSEAQWPGISGARVLVTGASSGLGAHFARLFAAHGAHVTAAARRIDRIDALCADIAASGGQAQALAMDVADATSVETALAGTPFDIVINNAGTTASGSALDLKADAIDMVIDTNLKGPFLVAQTAAQTMIAQGIKGRIINIASILGTRVAGGVSAYAASKAGVVQLTRTLALEWARYGIRVNAISPGYIETEINKGFFETEQGQKMLRRIPQRRIGMPSDLDGPALLLASDLSGFMTGADLAVDGGHLVSSL